MKKTACIILAIALIFSFIPSGAISAKADEVPTVIVSSASGTAGDTLTITISFENNSGITSFKGRLTYDSAILELQPTASGDFVEYNNDFGGVFQQPQKKDSPLTLQWANPSAKENIKINGTFATIVFKILDTATESKESDLVLQYDPDDVYDKDENNVNFSITNGKATVKAAPLKAITLIGSVTTPAKNTKDESKLEAENVNVEVQWNESLSDGKFKPSTVYTATVTVTAAEGYEIASDASVSIQGDSSFAFTYDEISKSFIASKTFPKTENKTFTALTITTAPTKTTYEHGDTLNTNGMVVKATYDDSTEDAAFTGYTVEYASGNYLKKGDTSVTIKAGSVSTTQIVTVSAKALTVSGLTATNRAYDGTTNVTLSGGSLIGVVSGETVTPAFPTGGTVADANVGNNKSVTFTNVTISGADAGNYTVTQPTVTVNITAKSITDVAITLGTQATYDGCPHNVVITSVGIDGLTPTYDITSGGSATNVEDTTLTITGNGNFSGTATTTWKLVKATPAAGNFDITAPSPVDYNGSATTVTTPALKSGKTGAGAVTVKYNGSTTAPTDAGSYTVTFDVAEGSNFNAANSLAIGMLTINKIDYDGTTTANTTVRSNEITSNATLTLPTLPSGASYGTVSTSGALIDGTPTVSGTTLTYSTTSQANNTTGTITIAVTGATNYYNYNVVVTITAKDKDPAGVTITEGSTLTKTYGDAAVTLHGTATATGANGAWTWTSSDTNVATVTDAGVVTIVGQGSSTITAKYESDTTIGEATLTLTVNKKDVTITGLSAQNKEYDGNANATVTGTATISGKVEGDDVTITVGTAAFADKTVGTGRTVTFSGYSLTGTKANNYNLTAQPASVTANITAKPVTATVTATNRDYAAGDTSVTLSAGSVSGVISGDTVTVDVSEATGTIADENAGSGKAVTVTGVKLGGADAGNYTLSAQPSGVTVTINQIAYNGAPLTATKNVLINNAQTGVEVDLAGLVSGITGATLTSAFEASDTDNIISNVAVSGSKVTFDVASVSDIGKTATITANFTATNYTGVTATITVTTVDKSDAGVTISGTPTEAKTYGDTDFTLTSSVTDAGTGTGIWTWTSSDPTVLSIDGTGNSATVSILKAGSATITAHYESDTTMGEAITASITVNKATITITAKNQSIYVNGTVPDLSSPIKGTHYDVTGLKDGDTLGGSLELKYEKDGVYTVQEDVDVTKTGSYDIVAMGAEAPSENYESEITYVSGKLTISSRPIVVVTPTTYTLTFNTNGGSNIDSITDNRGTTVDLSKFVPTREGYTFDGWCSDEALTAAVTSVTLNGNTTVYAKWTEDIFENPFTDVEEDSFYYDAVEWAVKNGITEGTSDTTFTPNGVCTRAQMVTFLWRAAGKLEPKTIENPFNDVDEGAYYYKAVLWAAENKITLGTGEGRFSPDAEVTRDQSVTFLYRAVGSKTEAENPFVDVSADKYYYDAVMWAVKNGVTFGTSATTFSPEDDCLRGQIVTFLYRSYNKDSEE